MRACSIISVRRLSGEDGGGVAATGVGFGKSAGGAFPAAPKLSFKSRWAGGGVGVAFGRAAGGFRSAIEGVAWKRFMKT